MQRGADWPEFRPTRLLRKLVDGGVDFVVIGGVAAVVHGSVQITRDLDICPSGEGANVDRLDRALVTLRARLSGLDAGTRFETDHGPLELLTDPDSEESLRKRALEVEVAGFVVRVASLKDLVAMKRASGRPKDLLAIEELEAIARLERGG